VNESPSTFVAYENLVSRAVTLMRVFDPPGTTALKRRHATFRDHRPIDSREAAVEVASILREYGRPRGRPHSRQYVVLMADFQAVGIAGVVLPIPTGNPGT
jgi:hypothetical protein